jgi:uncharacterized protein (DUF433 family)
MLDWSQCPAVERIPGKVSGAWLFKGTRVPVKALFENLEGGATVAEFLEWFPGVTRGQVEAVLEHAQRSLIEESSNGVRACLPAKSCCGGVIRSNHPRRQSMPFSTSSRTSFMRTGAGTMPHSGGGKPESMRPNRSP